jgi:hypothetical protein
MNPLFTTKNNECNGDDLVSLNKKQNENNFHIFRIIKASSGEYAIEICCYSSLYSSENALVDQNMLVLPVTVISTMFHLAPWYKY